MGSTSLSFSSTHSVPVTNADINKLIGGMENLIARSLTPEIALISELADDLWTTEINAGDFEGALINLVINARHAMSGGGTLTLKTRNHVLDDDYCVLHPTAEPGEYVEVTVSDTGDGMSQKQQQRIFEPFYTTKELGTGLGLAMLHGFMTRSKGHIDISSEIGLGTTFRLYMPRADGACLPRQSDNAVTTRLPQGVQTLLIVDDEESTVRMAKLQLEELGYRVLVANNGQEALEVLDGDLHVDLLFTDVVMPGGMTGYELATRATSSSPRLKVLLTSGYDQMAMTRTRVGHYAARVLSKPYSLDELSMRIKVLLDDSTSIH